MLDLTKPLICPAAIEFFDGILTEDDVVFEYGSGGSTPWLAERVKHVTSIESDRTWCERTQKRLKECNLHNIDLWFYALGLIGYADVILNYPDDHFDVVYVDGLKRPRCIANAKAKIKPGGWLVLDDSNWARLRAAQKPLSDWEHIKLCGEKDGRADGKIVHGCTSFYKKPECSNTLTSG